MNTKKGFTLIELMVVVAIIGILSAVVLAALNTSKSKGSDTAIQANLHSLQNQIELYYYNHNNGYGTVGTQGACTTTGGAGSMFTDQTIAPGITATDNANGTTGAITCTNSATAYAISAQMVLDTTKYWCIDSTGKTSPSSNALATNRTSCP